MTSNDLPPGVLVLPNTATEDEWLAARRKGIGASEIAAAAGLSRRRGPWDVWAAKVDGVEWVGTDEMRWGQFIEGRIVDWWARETGHTVGNGGLFRHPEHEWLLATPDALVLDYPGCEGAPPEYVAAKEPTVTAVVDAKNAGWHMAGEWDDDGAPLEYICQITQQMLAVGVRDGYLVAAIGGKPPTERHFSLDDELAGGLIERGAALWRMVQERTPPPLDGSASATRWLAARYPDADPDLSVQLSIDDVSSLTGLVALDERIAALKASRAAIENTIKERLGKAEVGSYGGRPYVTWKTVKRAGYEVKPTSFRKFTIPKKIAEELGCT